MASNPFSRGLLNMNKLVCRRLEVHVFLFGFWFFLYHWWSITLYGFWKVAGCCTPRVTFTGTGAGESEHKSCFACWAPVVQSLGNGFSSPPNAGKSLSALRVAAALRFGAKPRAHRPGQRGWVLGPGIADSPWHWRPYSWLPSPSCGVWGWG